MSACNLKCAVGAAICCQNDLEVGKGRGAERDQGFVDDMFFIVCRNDHRHARKRGRERRGGWAGEVLEGGQGAEAGADDEDGGKPVRCNGGGDRATDPSGKEKCNWDLREVEHEKRKG